MTQLKPPRPLPPPPPEAIRHPALPNPVVTTRGRVHCSEPLVVGGSTVGYCCALVHPNGTRLSRPGWHKGPHRIEWWGS